MSNELTTQAENRRPVLADDPTTREIVRVLTLMKLADGERELRRELKPGERKALERRKIEIGRFLRPIDRADEERRHLAQTLGQMFLGFGTANTKDAAAKVSAYIEGLLDQPLHAILCAIDDIRRGNTDLDSSFAPTSVDIVKAAKKYTEDARAELAAIDATLRGKPGQVQISEAERARIGAGLKDLAKGMRANLDGEKIDKGDEFAKAAAARNNSYIGNEWERYGLEPRYADKEKTIPVSLALARMNNPELDVQCRNIEKRRK
jgi:hypothetical protein